MVGIGSDHGGFELKCGIIKYFEQENISYKDFGSYDTKSVDYPIYAKKVSRAVLSGQCSNGILICGTGVGISIAANKIKGIRAALCNDVFTAKATKSHNNSNILAMGGRVIGAGHAIEIVKAFLETEFSNEQKHINRVNQLED